METQDKNINHKKRLILIIILIAAAAVICLLLVFKPWETTNTISLSTANTEQSPQSSEANALLEDPDSHVGEEVSFTAEAATDSQNIEGMLILSGVVDNQYFVSIGYLDRDQNLSFNAGDKVNVTGMITGSTLVSVGEDQLLNGADIAAQSVELAY